MNTKINVAALSTLFHSDVNAGSKPEPQAKEAVDDARAFVSTHARRHVTLSLLTQLQLFHLLLLLILLMVTVYERQDNKTINSSLFFRSPVNPQ